MTTKSGHRRDVAQVDADEVVVILLATAGFLAAFLLLSAMAETIVEWWPWLQGGQLSPNWTLAGVVVMAMCAVVALAVRGLSRR